MDDRTSSIDYDDCDQCAREVGSGICSNCDADGSYCLECESTGKCIYCEGSGRRKWEPSPEERAEIEAAGPLIAPPGDDEK